MTQKANTTILYRPVGQKELDLIRESDGTRFPQRLPGQPIFYPVLTEEYAIRIARDWNTRDAASGHMGYVTRFAVRTNFLAGYQVQQAGGGKFQEYWIPAGDLAAFNDNLVGVIEVIHEFRPVDPPVVALRVTSAALDDRLMAIAEEQPYPLLFVTISGAHLYGFPSPDSDYDLRGVHILPADETLGLYPGRDTIEVSGLREGLEIDLVTHDAKKFFTLLLKKNGYVLEQLLSPLVVHTTPEHEELKALAVNCITRHHAHHYLGFAETQRKLFEMENPRRVKPLLYVYRVLLTGIHLMQTGRIEANLLRLNEEAKLPYIDELVARKLAGPEQSVLPDADFEFHSEEFSRLVAKLEAEMAESRLPDAPSAGPALNRLLVKLRLGRLPPPGNSLIAPSE